MTKKIHDSYIKIDGTGKLYLLLFFKFTNGMNFSMPINLTAESELKLKDLLDSHGNNLDTDLKIERRVRNDRRFDDIESSNFITKFLNRFK